MNKQTYSIILYDIDDFELRGKCIYIKNSKVEIHLPCNDLNALWISHIKSDPSLLFPAIVNYVDFNGNLYIYMKKEQHIFECYFKTQVEVCKDFVSHPYDYMYGQKTLKELDHVIKLFNDNCGALIALENYLNSFLFHEKTESVTK